MIIRPLSRRWGAAQCLAQRCRATVATPSPRFTRNHSLPTLRNNAELQSNGIPGLLSAKAFDTAWTKYHGSLVNMLNELTAGSQHENQEVKALAIEWARNPEQASAFNWASMAFNNHFFFKGINPDPDARTPIPTELLREINSAFSSLDSFRTTFLDTAEVMFGPGFVWLVQKTGKDKEKKLGILTTYLAGSPLSGAHWRRQSHDLNTHNPDSYKNLNSVGAFGDAAKVENDKKESKPEKPLGGVDIVPLLCVNTWQHVWLEEYGVLGKRNFLEAWWDRIDWNTVRDLGNFTTTVENSKRQFVY